MSERAEPREAVLDERMRLLHERLTAEGRREDAKVVEDASWAIESLETDAVLARPAADERLREIVGFLLGEERYRGVWFGQIPPGEHDRYWWRWDLRAALSAPAAGAGSEEQR